MVEKIFLRASAVTMLAMISVIVLGVGVHRESALWMLEISEETARAYDQLCIEEDGCLYSVYSWVPEPVHRSRLLAKGVSVADYATIYDQCSYEEIVACTDSPIPIVTKDVQVRHYYFVEEAATSFRPASFVGYKDGKRVYAIDQTKEYLFTAPVGPDGYAVYDLSSLEDGFYYVYLGGLVEIRHSK